MHRPHESLRSDAERDALCLANLGLVGVAVKHAFRSVHAPRYQQLNDWEDCYSVGTITLMRAAQLFDETKLFHGKPAKFSTYAVRSIIVAVTRWLRQHSKVVAYPDRVPRGQFRQELIVGNNDLIDAPPSAAWEWELPAQVGKLPPRLAETIKDIYYRESNMDTERARNAARTRHHQAIIALRRILAMDGSDEVKCIHPDCGQIMITRGLCPCHYQQALGEIKAGRTTWDKMIAEGRARGTKRRVRLVFKGKG